jgi:hypothetical protein
MKIIHVRTTYSRVFALHPLTHTPDNTSTHARCNRPIITFLPQYNTYSMYRVRTRAFLGLRTAVRVHALSPRPPHARHDRRHLDAIDTLLNPRPGLAWPSAALCSTSPGQPRPVQCRSNCSSLSASQVSRCYRPSSAPAHLEDTKRPKDLHLGFAEI